MSKRKFDATIVFMTVPGEEQGLLGATHYAQQAVDSKTNIEAMFTNDIVGGVTSQEIRRTAIKYVSLARAYRS
jgi:Zn-dependent M28 family amino/carboxypeptidase